MSTKNERLGYLIGNVIVALMHVALMLFGIVAMFKGQHAKAGMLFALCAATRYNGKA